jgi:uncharacterized damage-inducible protein DinB
VNLLVEHYRAIASYNAWANRRLHEVCRRLSDEEFALQRTSFFPSLQLTLNHILLVDRYYVLGLEGVSPDYSIFAQEVPYSTMTELSPAQRDLDRRLFAFCNSLDAAELERVVVLDRGADGIHRETVASVLPHLFMHQIHHRGQATAMLAGSREKTPQLDEFFLLADGPVRDRELAATYQ